MECPPPGVHSAFSLSLMGNPVPLAGRVLRLITEYGWERTCGARGITAGAPGTTQPTRSGAHV